MKGPRRIVCLTEETTEALYLMGEEERIVGISSFTRRPERARKEKPVVCQFIKADADLIEAQRPDLVLGFSDLQADVCADLIRRGLEVHCFNQHSVAGALAMLRTLGALIGRVEAGEELAARLEAGLEAARARAAALRARPRVFFEEWPDPIITGSGWVGEIVEAAGGIDCFAELRGSKLAKGRIVAAEQVAERRPDLYLASWCGKRFSASEARERPGFGERPWTRDGRMVEIDSLIILAPGPAALTDGLAAIEREVHRVARELADGGA